MKVKLDWSQKMTFDASLGEHHVTIDAKKPIGQEKGPTPKELLLSGICGCSAMDVIGLLRKHKQSPKSFSVMGETALTKGHPSIFEQVKVTFDVCGDEVSAERLCEAIELSQTKYCGVTAMVADTSPVIWIALLNGLQVGSGRAKFDLPIPSDVVEST